MRFLMKLAVLAAVVLGGVWVYGRSLPREHRVTSSIALTAAPDSVYAVIRDLARTPDWWSDVNSMKRLTGKRRESWEQLMKLSGPVQIEVTSETPGQRLVMTVLNDDQKDWGGKWTYDVMRTGVGAEVRMTEDGWVQAPLYRVLMKVRGGPNRTINSYLKSLGAHFGETVTPRRASRG